MTKRDPIRALSIPGKRQQHARCHRSVINVVAPESAHNLAINCPQGIGTADPGLAAHPTASWVACFLSSARQTASLNPAAHFARGFGRCLSLHGSLYHQGSRSGHLRKQSRGYRYPKYTRMDSPQRGRKMVAHGASRGKVCNEILSPGRGVRTVGSTSKCGSFAPFGGLARSFIPTHGLRRGLPSFARFRGLYPIFPFAVGRPGRNHREQTLLMQWSEAANDPKAEVRR